MRGISAWTPELAQHSARQFGLANIRKPLRSLASLQINSLKAAPRDQQQSSRESAEASTSIARSEPHGQLSP
jgi:hypothetical protein